GAGSDFTRNGVVKIAVEACDLAVLIHAQQEQMRNRYRLPLPDDAEHFYRVRATDDPDLRHNGVPLRQEQVIYLDVEIRNGLEGAPDSVDAAPNRHDTVTAHTRPWRHPRNKRSCLRYPGDHMRKR